MENTQKTEQIELELDLEPLEAEKKEDDLIIEEAPEPSVKVKEPELSIEDGISELKARLEEEKKAREVAEKRYREAQEQAAVAKNNENDSNLRLIDNAIETVKRNSEILKQNLKDAIAVGDADSQANIMLEIQRANSDLDKLIVGKNQYEIALKQQAITDPIEKLASQATPESAKWLREHKNLLSDSRKLDRALRAHQDALDDGIEVDTHEYFDYIEGRLGINKQQQQSQQEESVLSEASAPTQRRSAPPAAPVSRSVPNNSGTRQNVVRLTAAEREHAAAFGMTDREYALQKQALIKAGKMAG